MLPALLFLMSAAFTLWRNGEVGVLVDISYIVNTATRIAAGDVPYAQFPLAQAPLEFLVQAFLIRLGGPNYGVQIAYATIVGGIATVLSFSVARRLLAGSVRAPDLVAAVLCLPLVPLGVYAVYPHPFYDSDSCVLVLAVIAAALWALDRPSRTRMAVAGSLLVVPAFMKQNIGGALIIAVLAALAAHAVSRPEARPWLRWYLAGFAVTLAIVVALVQIVIGIDQYLRWTLYFALSGRGVAADRIAEFGVPAALALVFVPLLRKRPATRVVLVLMGTAALIAASLFARSLIFVPGFFPPVLVAATALALVRARRDGPIFGTLVPIVVLATTLGVLQSLGLTSSTFAIFPLLVIALASLVRDAAWAAPGLAVFAARSGMTVAFALVVLGTIYTLTNARLEFVDVNAPGPVEHAAYPSLAGLSARGPYLADLDEILRWIDGHVGPDESLAMLPGEEPVFFALGRRPVLPSVYFYDVATPYSPDELARIADERGLRWVFVKDRLQLMSEPPLNQAIVAALTARATLVDRVGAYRIYRREPK